MDIFKKQKQDRARANKYLLSQIGVALMGLLCVAVEMLFTFGFDVREWKFNSIYFSLAFLVFLAWFITTTVWYIRVRVYGDQVPKNEKTSHLQIGTDRALVIIAIVLFAILVVPVFVMLYL